ncbi:hypothetical protein CL645_03935 [bacterium]|nr:hypothetical protein [bacterium]
MKQKKFIWEINLKLVDIFVLRQIRGLFLYGLVTFTFLVLFSASFKTAVKMIVDMETPISQVSEFLALGIPQSVVVAIPMTILLASILTFSQLSSSGELRAALVSGSSLRRIASSVIVIGFFSFLLSVSLNEFVIPSSVEKMEKLAVEIYREGRAQENDVNFESYYPSGNMKWNLIAQNLDNNVLNNLHLFRYEDQENQLMFSEYFLAEKGLYISNDGSWELLNVVTLSNLGSGRFANLKQDKVRVFFEESPTNIKKLRTKDVQEMNYLNAKNYVSEVRKRGESMKADKLATQTELKIAVPFASIIFSLLGVAMGSSFERKSVGPGMGIGMSMLVIFFYYVVMLVGIALSKIGLSAIVAAWFPNFLFLIVSSFILLKRENPILFSK